MTYYSSAAACRECPNCAPDDSGGGPDGEGDGTSGGCYLNTILLYDDTFTHSFNQPAGVGFDQLRNLVNGGASEIGGLTFGVENVCHGGQLNPTIDPTTNSNICLPNLTLNDCSDTVGYQTIQSEPGSGLDNTCHILTYKERSGEATIPFKICRTKMYDDRDSYICMTEADFQPSDGGPRPVNKFAFHASPFTERDVLNSCLFRQNNGIATPFNDSTTIYPPYVGSMNDPNGAGFFPCCDESGLSEGDSFDGPGFDNPPWCASAKLTFQWGPPFNSYLGPLGLANSPTNDAPYVFEPFSSAAPHEWNKRAKAFFSCDMFFEVEPLPDPFDINNTASDDDFIPNGSTRPRVRHTVSIIYVGRCTPNNEVDVANQWLFEPKYAWVSRPCLGDRFALTTNGYLWKGPTLEEAGVTASNFSVQIDWDPNPLVVI